MRTTVLSALVFLGSGDGSLRLAIVRMHDGKLTLTNRRPTGLTAPAAAAKRLARVPFWLPSLPDVLPSMRYDARMPLSATTRRRFSVWLALLAMWLVVVVPVASQLTAAAHAATPDTASILCSATAAHEPAASPHLHTDRLAACGYCSLLAHQPAMPAPPAIEPAFVAITVALADALPTAQHVPAAAFPSGRPRAPPAAFYA